jgi:hypothetical protein
MADPAFTLTISADVIAWYGAVVATISAIWSGLSYFRDKSKVRVRIAQGFAMYPSDTRQIFLLEAVNHGRRPCTLTGAGFLLKDGAKIAIYRPETITFPYELHEGKAVTISIEKSEMVEQMEKRSSSITHAYYQDATGKTFRIRVSKKLLD